MTREPGLEGAADQQMQRGGQKRIWAMDPGLGCKAQRAQRAAPCGGAMKAGEGDADGPVPTKKPVRVEWYDEFWELTYVSAAGEGNWGEQ